MTYTKQGPFTTGDAFSAAEATAIDLGVYTADQDINNTTGADTATMPSSDGPFTFINWLKYFMTQLKAITGGAHWYTAPTTTISALSTGKAALSGATFTGAVEVTAALTTNSKAVVFAQTGITGKFSAASTAPSSPADGDLWLDTSTVLG